MTFKQLILPMLALWLAMASLPLYAGEQQAADAVSASALKADLSKPYIVKKGDSLWNIANHFFKDPWKWLKIWEHNLYITNPDLIYPGNKIWFDGNRLTQGGLSMVRPQPQVVIRPVERMEGYADSSLLLTSLQRQGFIQPNMIQGAGYILDSRDDRLNYGAHDFVFLKLNQPAKVGTLFDVFRSTDTLHDPQSGNALGVLIKHMGQIRISSEHDGIFRGVIVKAFEEISRGDRVKPARVINHHLVLSQSKPHLTGSIIYIRNDAHEAAQHQVVGISLGLNDGLKAGMQMYIYKAGRTVEDKVSGGTVLLPQQRIGAVVVLAAQPQAAIALITKSTMPVNIGDAIYTELLSIDCTLLINK
ncbi:MAG: LysM peptidoglycan-binding domain-containing protein [Mariprofundus sp.]|nr:LysM peptidoglycan-binding domain-containing protein [Mariprofundus sp.]